MASHSRRKALLSVTALALVTGSIVWTLDGGDREAGLEELSHHPWLSRMPADDRDIVGHLVFLDLERQGRFGVLGQSSQWRHRLEVFRWRVQKDEVLVFFPQDGEGGRLRARLWECEDEAPAPFDLCLELADRQHRAVLYSRQDWRIDQRENLEAQAALPAGVRASLESVPTENEKDLSVGGEVFPESGGFDLLRWLSPDAG